MGTDFSFIIKDNESAAQEALIRGDYLQAFLLVHALVESVMRIFLGIPDEDYKFNLLIEEYKKFLNQESPGISSFVEDLKQFNRRRNRIAHNLWRKGYTFTNRQAKDAAYTAVMVYGLFIEFLQTYDEDLRNKGFHNDEGA